MSDTAILLIKRIKELEQEVLALARPLTRKIVHDATQNALDRFAASGSNLHLHKILETLTTTLKDHKNEIDPN